MRWKTRQQYGLFSRRPCVQDSLYFAACCGIPLENLAPTLQSALYAPLGPESEKKLNEVGVDQMANDNYEIN